MIGRQWAILFTSFGFDTFIYDTEQKQLDNTKSLISQHLESLKEQGVLRGDLTIPQRLDHVQTTSDLEVCITGALYVQVNGKMCCNFFSFYYNFTNLK